jgi:YidC/Oxa1 family membrane protein insertase
MTAMLVFSILSPIENAVRWLLDEFHKFGLPWSWAIVATTIAVRILLVPLTVRQIHSMQSLQKHAPEMKEIQRKYKGDRQKLNEELMKFYKENHINPAASCLPLVAQLPVFFALYFVLKDFSKHPPPGSLSWLHIVPDISAKANAHWSGYLLLAIYAGSQILSSYFMSTTMDKAQRVILMIVPLVFISVVAHFPMGLVLYWVTTNLWTVGQGLITRRLVPKTPMPSPFGSRRTRTTSTPAKADGKTPAPARAAAPKPKPQQPAARRVKKKKGGPRR